jgi:hypothetical protein
LPYQKPSLTIAIPKPSLTTTAIPKPFKNVETQNSVSILSKTDTYLQERNRRSNSQPPEKRVRQKLEFLSTSRFSSLPNKECRKAHKANTSYKSDKSKKLNGSMNNIKSNDKPWTKNIVNSDNHRIHSLKDEKQIDSNFQKSCRKSYPQAFLQTLV